MPTQHRPPTEARSHPVHAMDLATLANQAPIVDMAMRTKTGGGPTHGRNLGHQLHDLDEDTMEALKITTRHSFPTSSKLEVSNVPHKGRRIGEASNPGPAHSAKPENSTPTSPNPTLKGKVNRPHEKTSAGVGTETDSGDDEDAEGDAHPHTLTQGSGLTRQGRRHTTRPWRNSGARATTQTGGPRNANNAAPRGVTHGAGARCQNWHRRPPGTQRQEKRPGRRHTTRPKRKPKTPPTADTPPTKYRPTGSAPIAGYAQPGSRHRS